MINTIIKEMLKSLIALNVYLTFKYSKTHGLILARVLYKQKEGLTK